MTHCLQSDWCYPGTVMPPWGSSQQKYRKLIEDTIISLTWWRYCWRHNYQTDVRLRLFFPSISFWLLIFCIRWVFNRFLMVEKTWDSKFTLGSSSMSLQGPLNRHFLIVGWILSFQTNMKENSSNVAFVKQRPQVANQLHNMAWCIYCLFYICDETTEMYNMIKHSLNKAES